MKTEQEQNQILKKELERSARLTGKDVFVDAYKIITEQEEEIARLRETLKQCNTELNSALESLKSQCREIGELKAGVKQAQIDILNKANERLNVVSRELGDDCDLCGVSAVCSCRCEINNLIKEVQNAEDKG